MTAEWKFPRIDDRLAGSSARYFPWRVGSGAPSSGTEPAKRDTAVEPPIRPPPAEPGRGPGEGGVSRPAVGRPDELGRLVFDVCVQLPSPTAAIWVGHRRFQTSRGEPGRPRIRMPPPCTTTEFPRQLDPRLSEITLAEIATVNLTGAQLVSHIRKVIE